MARTTVPTNGKNDKLGQRVKLMHLELTLLRHNVRFLELLAAERKLKAKRLGLEASFYEGLYRQELYRQEQHRKVQQEQQEGAEGVRRE